MDCRHLPKIKAPILYFPNFVQNKQKKQACTALGFAREVVNSSQAEGREVGRQSREVKVSFSSWDVTKSFLKGAEVSWQREFLRSKLVWSSKERRGERRW